MNLFVIVTIALDEYGDSIKDFQQSSSTAVIEVYVDLGLTFKHPKIVSN
jgi:hypothetical protein